MMILSEKLALSLRSYDELEDSLKKDIAYYKEHRVTSHTKGDVVLFNLEDQYLCVDPNYYEGSLLKSVYGDYIDRTNENSFDTELYFFFTELKYYNREINIDDIKTFVKGMEVFAKDNSFVTLWHLIIQSTLALKKSRDSNYTQLLMFYSIIEAILLTENYSKNQDRNLSAQSGRKLPVFLNNSPYDNGIQGVLGSIFTNNLANIPLKDVFGTIAQMRNKVIHGNLKVANNKLNELFPNPKSLTEDAESSAFQDQLISLNKLIGRTLSNILLKWLENPNGFQDIKNDIMISEKQIKEILY